MSKTRWLAAILAAGALTVAADAKAQSLFPIAAEVNGSVAVPSSDLGDLAKTGVGFSATAEVGVLPMLAVYGGYNWAQFGAEDGGLYSGDLTDSGFVVGGKVTLPVSLITGADVWAKGGAVFHKLEGDVGTVSTESDRGTGFEVGGGLSIPLGMVVSVTPGVTYRAYSADIAAAGELDVNSLHFGVGLKFGF